VWRYAVAKKVSDIDRLIDDVVQMSRSAVAELH